MTSSIAVPTRPDRQPRLAIREEAISTSAIEGTYAAMEDVLKADFVEPSDIGAEVAEVHNYKAMSALVRWRRRPPSGQAQA